MHPENPSRSLGLGRLANLQDYNQLTGLQMADHAKRFDRLKSDAAATRAVSSFNLFQTPEALADRVVEIAADGRTLGTILEPSAGLGRLYRAARKVSDAHIVMVEFDQSVYHELKQSALADPHRVSIMLRDFLICTPEGIFETTSRPKGAPGVSIFDTVLMNPPFKNGADIKHIRHALTFLKPGGRLVSIVANGPRQREALIPIASQWIDLELGAFKSEATNVNAAIFVYDKE